MPILFDDETGVYFLENIEKSTDANGEGLHCWIKIIYSISGQRMVYEAMKECGLPANGYENLQYTREHVIFLTDNYPRLLAKINSSTNYAADDEILDISNTTDQPFREVAPDSVLEKILNTVIQRARAHGVEIIPSKK